MGQVGIIGGGASGIMAAIAAMRAGATVRLWEKNPVLGRKLLATGNGRCNLSNCDLDLAHFHAPDSEFVAAVLRRLDGKRTLEFFREIGVETVADARGRYFPASNEATAVLACLTGEMERLGAMVAISAEIVGIEAKGRCFLVRRRGSSEAVAALIIACGGRAGPGMGTQSGYALAQQLGHTVTELRPGLVPLMLCGSWFHKLQGVRWDMTLTVSRAGKRVLEITDEGLFTRYGLSGPLALRSSRAIGEGDCEVTLSFMPEMNDAQAERLLAARQQRLSHRPVGDFLTGLLPAKLGRVIAAECGLALEMPCGQLGTHLLAKLACSLTHWPVRVRGLCPFSEAQVTVGGVNLHEINPATMSSRLVPGLFFCGEVVDVDGDSGGYNLQWAWSSGYVAGTAAAAFVRGRS